MEASKFWFGLGTPSALMLDSTDTDADIVTQYLLPRALGLDNPRALGIIEDDPNSLPPWEILLRYGLVAAADYAVHALFFSPPTDASSQKGGRTVQGGGVWQGQQETEETVTVLRPGGEVNIRFKRYNLSFSCANSGPSSGYVMHEYEILSPPLPGIVLTRIKAEKGAYRPAVIQAPPMAPKYEPDPSYLYDAAEQQEVIQAPPMAPQYEPGPSYLYDAAANGEGFAGAHDGALYDSKYVPPPPTVEYDDSYSYRISIQDQPATTYSYSYSYSYNAATMMNNGDSFTGAEANTTFYGDGMVQTAGTYSYGPSNCVPDCECGAAEYINYCGEYQKQDPSNQYQAGDHATLMCPGTEEFIGEQQTAALCGNSDNASAAGTETSAHSTFWLCGDREDECDDTTFDNFLFCIGEDDRLSG